MAGQLLRPRNEKKKRKKKEMIIIIIDFSFTCHMKLNLILGMRNSIVPNPSNNQPPAKDHMDPEYKVEYLTVLYLKK